MSGIAGRRGSLWRLRADSARADCQGDIALSAGHTAGATKEAPFELTAAQDT